MKNIKIDSIKATKKRQSARKARRVAILTVATAAVVVTSGLGLKYLMNVEAECARVEAAKKAEAAATEKANAEKVAEQAANNAAKAKKVAEKEAKKAEEKAAKKAEKKAAKKAEKKAAKKAEKEKVSLSYDEEYNVTKEKLNAEKGVNYYEGRKETFYSVYEPGQTVTAKEIPGKHVAEDGTYRDKDGYICVAMPMDGSSCYSYGDVIMTSLGPGKVYDCGDMTGDWIDIYTNWEV